MKNLKQLLSEETVKQIIPTLRTVALVVLVAFVLLFAKAQLSDRDEKIEQQIAVINQFKKDAEAANKFADSLNKIIVVKQQEAGAAEARAQVLGTQVGRLKRETSTLRSRADSIRESAKDSVELARRLIPLQDSIIATQDSTITKQGGQITQLGISLAKKDTTIRLLTVSRDSLQALLRVPPKPPTNPNKLFGFINLPSRKTTAIVAGAAGAVLGVLLVK